MMIVLAFGMSRPFSTIVVASRTSNLRADEVEHRPLERVLVHLPVADDDPRFRHEPLQQVADREDRLDAVVDEVDLAAAFELAADRPADHLLVELDDVGLDRQAILGRRLDDRHVADADERHVRACAESASRVIVSTSTFRRSCLIFSLCATPNRCSSSTTSRPRSRNSTSFDSSRCVPTMMSTLPAARSASVSFCSALLRNRLTMSMRDREAGEALAQRLLVLERQHGRRREKRDLLAVHHRLERGAHRDLGLAVADVAAEQPVHRRRRFHVALDVGDRRLLIRRQLVLEGVLELLLPVRIGAERVARARPCARRRASAAPRPCRAWPS